MKYAKLITVILIILSIVCINAFTLAVLNPDNYRPNRLQENDVKGFEKYGGKVAGAIQVIGTIVSVGAMMIIGIRYVVASADEKAEYKERMIPYFIGAILLFGASNIVNIIYNIFIYE